jgi:hypothetical protein
MSDSDTEIKRVDLVDAMGGRHGIAESGIPALVFVIAYTATGNDLTAAVWSAVGVGVVAAVVRLLRRETLQFALAGLAGVALAAFVASRTGRAEDFFLPGLLLNAGYAAAYAISIAVRWPLIGLIVGALLGEGTSWRENRDEVRLYSRASWIWVGVFVLRLAVQLPLYLTGSLVALGVAKTAMGLPVFLLGVWLTYLVLHAGGIDLGRRVDDHGDGEQGA